MRSILCLSVLALATSVAAAQYDPRYGAPGSYDDELRSVQDQLETLQLDRRVQRNAGTELARAESFIDQLTESPPHTLRDEDFEHANMLLEQAREVALERAEMRRQARRGEHRGDRDVVIVERDERARAEAERARHDADLARAEAEAEREAARAAQLEAEQERERNEELMSDLRGMRPRETERGVVVTLGDVLFEVGRSDLRASALGTLRELTMAMRENPEASVVIEGHTDSTGSRSFNQTLSERRANAVRSFLTRQGIAAARIQTRGLGPDVPIASNRTAAGRAQNRRVEVIVQG